MKKTLLIILSALSYYYSFAQTRSYWQQQVNYKIDVSLNDGDNSLDGYVRMQYHNNSPDSLHFVWIHIWPNAYKNDKTAFNDQLLENGRTDFYFSNETKKGYINRLDFKVDKITAATEDHPVHQDIIKLILPVALPPHGIINIETPFHVKLPYNFSRGGYVNKTYQITQWYPKPAVYDKNGWHEMPYLDQGEFYSEFGKYDVTISVHKDYVVAATGVLQNESMQDSIKTLHYLQDSVHDFAWFADKDFSVLHDTLQLATKTIDVFAYHSKADSASWGNSIAHIKAAVQTKSNWIGEYPYNIVSVVEGAGRGDGGMEYPTITLIDNPGDEKSLDLLINHEVGHNWFYGILASNERQFPWMDEGMNSYYDNRYISARYQDTGSTIRKTSFIGNRQPDDMKAVILEGLITAKKDQPIATSSEAFSAINYNLVAYTKAAQWMELLEGEIGKDNFERLMKEYYNAWRFKHPCPEDFKKLAEEISGKRLDSTFSLLNKKGTLQKPVKKDLRLASFFSFKETDKHHYIFIAPAVGINYYDKFMIGAFIHNYTMPATRFQFFLSPLYATGSKEINGLTRLSYNAYTGNSGQKAEIAIAGAKFTADNFTDSAGAKHSQPFIKIVPSLKYIFGNRDPKSRVKKYVQWKTFLIRETGLLFSYDPVQQADIISYPKQWRYINQLELAVENSRVLYPYHATFQAEQGEKFVRLNFTGNYFFNYAHEGGLNVRFFAGKFIYTTDKTFLTQFETDPYHLNMTGPKGYEDYTYRNYFAGRNEFEGFISQQIMNRDGAFKVRTDLLSSKIGKTDDWLTAINFTTTIPSRINPLSLLPFRLPLKIFADIGTYAEAWKENSGTGKFLYDAGIQLSLFRDIINVYYPILYSKEYDSYFESTITEKKFVKSLSFSIDIQNSSLKKLIPQIPF